MKDFREDNLRTSRAQHRLASLDALSAELEQNGLVVLPDLLAPAQLGEMQKTFAARLDNLRWIHFEGYQRTELYRLMVEDVLQLAQGFVDLAIHPLVRELVARYVGPNYQLTEAKGWKSLPTDRDFHGWHGDMWYEQAAGAPIHREVKLAMYLTDVSSGAFRFIKGTHRKQHPHILKSDEIKALRPEDLIEVKGAAGTAFLFDTSTTHRQGIPMLEPRQAIFYAYHDPGVPLQQEGVEYNRYHPLLLNAALLGNLSREDERVLGFGDQRSFRSSFVRKDGLPALARLCHASMTVSLRVRMWRELTRARLARLLGS